MKMRDRSLSDLLDDLVGGGEQRWRHGEADGLGGLQVDDELELGRLQNWQVGWLLTLEDTAGVDAELAVSVGKARSVAHQPAGFDKLALRIDRRKRASGSER